jgi:hypothetical protein
MTKIPSVTDIPRERAQKAFKPVAVVEKIAKLTIRVPASSEIPSGYVGDKLGARDMRADIRMTKTQTLNCYAIMRGLQECGMKLSNGAEIRCKGDVFRYMLENCMTD